MKADSGETLGETVMYYYDDLEESMDIVVKNQLLHPAFFLKMALEAQNNCADAQDSKSRGKLS